MQAFIKGIEAKYQEVRPLRTSLLNSEKEWANSVRDLYTFAIENHRYFRSSGNNVQITDDTVLNDFNEKVEHANELNANYQSQMKAFGQRQKESATKLGLSVHDFGLD